MKDETKESIKNKDLLNPLKTEKEKSSPSPTSILSNQSKPEIHIPYDTFSKSTEQRLPSFMTDLSYDDPKNNLWQIIPRGYISIKRFSKNGNLKDFMNKFGKQEFAYLGNIIDNENNHKLRLDNNNPNCRYSNILTYKDNRVILNASNKYFNASWIHLPLPNYFIATQGPLPHTIEDFWTMIDQYNVTLIVMLCNLKENNTDKCADYWHDNNFKYLETKFLSEKEDQKGIFIRNISLKNKLINKETIVKQIHLTYWEDHTALEPIYFNTIIRILKHIDNVKNKNFSPCVVHCSAGVGRTGTLISLYNLYHELMQQIMVQKTEWITFSIMNLVRKMKEMRIYSIQTENQYLLLYDFADYILSYSNVVK